MQHNVQLSALASEIERLEASLKVAKQQYTQLYNSLAPIAILPSELLAAIFEAGCNQDSPPIDTKLPFELLVSHISRHWRSVAHETPHLWTEVVVDTMARHHIAIGADYICRSGALPLDLRVIMTNIREFARPAIKPICHLICPQIKRWYQFRVTTNWYAGLQYLFDNMPNHAPLLQLLDICYENSSMAPPGEPSAPRHILTGDATSLTKLVLHGVTLQCHFPPLTALTSLECHRLVLSAEHPIVRDMFEGLTQLTHLVLNDVDFDWTAVDGIELLSLTALYLQNIPDYDRILAVMSAPSLHTLYLNTVDSGEIRNFPSALASDSAQPKFPLLRFLAIKPVTYEPFVATVDTWKALSLITPTISHFALLHDQVDDFLQSFAFLTQTESPTTPLATSWPELHTLSLPEGTHTNLLDAIVSERVALGCPIRKVQVSAQILSWLGGGVEALKARVEVVDCTLEGIKNALYPVQWLGAAREAGSWLSAQDGDDISDFTDISSDE